jgi:transketolase
VRNEFIEQLGKLAERDSRIALLTGDLGFTVLEDFAERFPDRFFNAGVAEQNMVGMATGLAESGRIPFVYSIATFASMRPYEFIRNGPALHELPVRIVGVGGGLDYGHNGITHYALEDVGLMRVQPSITTVAPADAAQAVRALDATWELPSTVYYRIGKQGGAISALDGRFSLGRAEVLSEGDDVAIIALGTVVAEALEAATLLDDQGISATVALVPSFNPSPTDDLAELLADIPVALAVEAHYEVGGLGSLVAETIAERGLDCRLVRCGVRAMPRGLVGTPDFLYREHGLDRESLARRAVEALSPVGS